MAENVTDTLAHAPLVNVDSTLVLNTILILILAYVSSRAVTAILVWVSEQVYGHRISIKMAIPLYKFSVYGIAGYYIAKSILELSTVQLVAFSGFAGAAIGFGLKDLVAEVVGGIVIVLDKPYQVGDKVKIGSHYGEVSDIGLRSTKLVTPDDNLVSVSNQMFLSQAVSNSNAGDQEMMVVIDLFIDSKSDATLAMAILREALVTSRYVYISKRHPAKVLLKDCPFYRRLRAKGYVYDLRQEFDFETDVTKRAWQAFREAGIRPPQLASLDVVN